MNIISEVLSACISSSRAEPMKLKLQNGKYFTIPGQVNVMLMMPSGSGKSTYIGEVFNKKDMVKITDYSLPALIGSINENSEMVPGFLMKAAGKTLWMDESHRMRSSAQGALLSVLERQWAVRILGRAVRRPVKIRKKYIKASTIDNEIRIDYVRFSALMTGLFAPHKKDRASLDDEALSSRFLPLSLKASMNDLDDVAVGKRYFSISKKKYIETPDFDDWVKFVKCYREVVNNLPPKLYAYLLTNMAFYPRIRLLLARLLGYGSRGNSVVTDWEQMLPYIPFFIYNCAASTLTHSEFEVYDLLKDDLTQKEIANRLGCSVQFVSKKIQKLRGVGLG